MKTLLTFLGSAILGATSVSTGFVQLHEINTTTDNITNASYSFDVSGYASPYTFGHHWQDDSTFSDSDAVINYNWISGAVTHAGLDVTSYNMSDAPVSDQWENYKSVLIFQRDIPYRLTSVTFSIWMDYHKGNDGKYNIRYRLYNSKSDFTGSYAHVWGTL